MAEEMMDDMQMLSDISHDTDSIIRMLGSEKMADSYDSGLIAGMLQNRGVDPGVLALMKDGDGFHGGNGLLLVLFLLILGGGNGFGWGNRGGCCDIAKESTLINEGNYNALMNAITSQGARQDAAIGDLATRMGCNFGDVKMALANVDKAIALSNGDIKSAIQSCCCNVRQEIAQASAKTDLELVRGFGDVKQDIQATRYLITAQGAAQDNLLQQKFSEQNAYLAEQFCAIKTREDQREIQALRDKLAEKSQDAQTVQIISAIMAPKGVSGTINATAGTWQGTVPTP